MKARDKVKNEKKRQSVPKFLKDGKLKPLDNNSGAT